MTDTDDIREKRDAMYGDPAVALPQVGRKWAATLSMFLGMDIPDLPGRIVCMMMQDMKSIRIAWPNTPEEALDDSYDDEDIYGHMARKLDGRTEK